MHKSQNIDAKKLEDHELALLMTVPLSISAEKIGENFSAVMKQRILNLRITHFDLLQKRLTSLFSPLDEKQFCSGFSVLENVIFGKLSKSSGTNNDRLISLVAEILLDADLKRLIAELSYNIETGLGGANLSSFDAEHLAFARAAIKMPDILVLDRVLASYDPETRLAASIKLRHAMPETTIIYLEDAFLNPQNFDVHIELQQARIQKTETEITDTDDVSALSNMNNKVRAFEATRLFSALDQKQLRILAFGSHWHMVKSQEYIFYKGNDSFDGAYLILEGEAGLYEPNQDGEDSLVLTVNKGSLVGEISLILDQPRKLNMRAHTDLKTLRIGKEEFLSVIKSDAKVCYTILEQVAGYIR